MRGDGEDRDLRVNFSSRSTGRTRLAESRVPMPRSAHSIFSLWFFCAVLLASFGGCSSNQPPAATAAPAPVKPIVLSKPRAPADLSAEYPVMLGVDVLAADAYSALAGKRVGLLTHRAGVNRYGVSTIEVLTRSIQFKFVALFSPEHGLDGLDPASTNTPDTRHTKTGLPVYSLHGVHRKPTKKQLGQIDVLVVDLQDNGSRSYTFTVCMMLAMEACFENGVEVVILDRPNPLGGLKVDGPLLDANLKSGVGRAPMPYVHGLTIGELARMAAASPGWLEISDVVRAKGKLTVVPMRGWQRAMRWPDTKLTFLPTSPLMPDFNACVGYAMVGLGTQLGGFRHGVREQFPFRGISHKIISADALLAELQKLKIPGLSYRKVIVPDKKGKPGEGIYVDVSDWEAWRPTELSFELMRLACKVNAKNPFIAASPSDAISFNKHTGSQEWFNALKRDGAKVDLAGFRRKWEVDALMFQQTSRRFWLYN